MIDSDSNRQLAIGNWKSTMRVGLFVTCLVDQMWSSIGTSSVAVLRRAGCDVTFDERQTCCGQPAFNTGYRTEARRVAERFIELCEDSKVDAIVSPSGSCTAMVHHYQSLFADDERWRYRTATGRIAPLTEVRLIDDDGNEVPWDGESTGEVQIRGPWIAADYFNDPSGNHLELVCHRYPLPIPIRPPYLRDLQWGSASSRRTRQAEVITASAEGWR